MATGYLCTPAATDEMAEETVVDIDMLTWNVGGSKSEKHFADLRKIIASTVKRAVGTDSIAFLQEITSSPAVKKWGFNNFDTSFDRGKKEAGVSIPNQIRKPLEILYLETINSVKLKALGVDEQYAKRLYGKKVLITTGPPTKGYTYARQITLLSYHAEYKQGNKTQRTVDFFDYMYTLALLFKQTIIIGGDFNFPVSEIETNLKRETRLKDCVQVALYMGTPRRWTNCIDTFAIVHPRELKHRRECQFNQTIPIYPFPMTGQNLSDCNMSDYPPPSQCPWFRIVNYNDKQFHQENPLEKIIQVLEEKKATLDEDLRKEQSEEQPNEKKIEKLMEKLEESKHWLSEPYARDITLPPDQQLSLPPAPLWPHSPLHQVLDHDPVLTTVRITLNLMLRETYMRMIDPSSELDNLKIRS